MRPIGAIAFVVLAAVTVWMAIANRAIVTLSFNALDPASPDASMAVPLFLVLLVGALGGLLAGAIYMWTEQLHLKRALKAEKERAERLQRMLADEALAKAAPPRPAHPALLQRLAD